jgi:hypothetical protein
MPDITSIADLWVPDVWIDAIVEKSNTFPSLLNSGVMVRSDLFNQIASGPGETATVPVWLDFTDQNDEVQVEDTGPTAQKIATAKQTATILNRVTYNPATALSAAVSGEDPVGYITGRLAERRLKQRQKTLLKILDALFNVGGPLATLSDKNFVEVVGNQTSAHMIDAAMIINATAALGERENDLVGGAMLVHPAILAALRVQDENNFERTSEGPFSITRYKGIPIYTSNALVRAGTTSGSVYRTYLCAANSFAYGEKPQLGDVIDVAALQFDVDKHKNNWGIYDRTRFLIHPNGTKFVGSPAGQSASDAELGTAASWQKVFQTNDRYGMVRIETNG